MDDDWGYPYDSGTRAYSKGHHADQHWDLMANHVTDAVLFPKPLWSKVLHHGDKGVSFTEQFLYFGKSNFITFQSWGW